MVLNAHKITNERCSLEWLYSGLYGCNRRCPRCSGLTGLDGGQSCSLEPSSKRLFGVRGRRSVDFRLYVPLDADLERLQCTSKPTLDRTFSPAPNANLVDTVFVTRCTSAALQGISGSRKILGARMNHHREYKTFTRA